MAKKRSGDGGVHAALKKALPVVDWAYELAVLTTVYRSPHDEEYFFAREILDAITYWLQFQEDDEARKRVERAYLAMVPATERRAKAVAFSAEAIGAWHAATTAQGRRDACSRLLWQLGKLCEPRYLLLSLKTADQALRRTTPVPRRGRGNRYAEWLAAELANACGAFKEERGGASAGSFHSSKKHVEKK